MTVWRRPWVRRWQRWWRAASRGHAGAAGVQPRGGGNLPQNSMSSGSSCDSPRNLFFEKQMFFLLFNTCAISSFVILGQ